MASYQVLFNPMAANGQAEAQARKLAVILESDDVCFHDMTGLQDYASFFQSIDASDRVVIAGGDGTLNCFINDTQSLAIQNDIYYYPCGSGNDFAHDIGATADQPPVKINQYLKDLPTVTVEGKTHRVLNGVGYGIDGYCCEVGDIMRANHAPKINYTSIAIKGLLFHYHPVNATITVDGVKHEYHKVWLAPVMNGRFYGGGMMPTPDQDRLNPDGTVSVMVMHGSGKLKTLMIFPSIFQGKHVLHTECVQVLTGHDITVEFDRPTALQIDGETHVDITRCDVHAGARETATV